MIPKSALVLAVVGLVPFVWGAGTIWSEDLYQTGLERLGPRFVGPFVLINYGTIILAFMSGVLWGFATRADGRIAALGYTLSTLPALFAFFFIGGGVSWAALMTGTGLSMVLALDWVFWRLRLAPEWWLSLRTPVTAIALICLSTVVFS